MEPTRVEQLEDRLDRLTERVDGFVHSAQRLLNQFGDRLQTSEFQAERIERLENVVRSLDRNYQQLQQNQELLQENQRSTTAAIERMDRILDYLVRQEGQE